MFKKQQVQIKAAAIRWHQFSRKADAIFVSMHREITIRTLTVATLLAAAPLTVAAQTAAPTEGARSREADLEEVLVTAARVPMTMSQSARIVSVMTREQIKDCPAQSVNDLLKYASSVDVRQRGAFGIQTDISINGGTHDQIVVLLNGVNVSSPQTGHLSVDLPISVDDIERIEILEGAASRVYGSSAFSGAINIVTRAASSSSPSTSSARSFGGSAGIQGGSFGTFGIDGSLQSRGTTSSHALSAGWQQSDGGVANSDFHKFRAYYQGSAALPAAEVQWQLGTTSMDYGANTFYSGRYPDQYESNRRYIASVGATTHGRIVLSPTLYFSRSLDHFQLVRHSSFGENFHMTDVYGATINARLQWLLGTSSIGADVRNEGILSTNLGRPLDADLYVDIPGHKGQYTKKDNRTNVSYFLEHNILLRQWTISAGVMSNLNTGLDYRHRLYPGVDVSYRPTAGLRLYAAWNMAQRMPTFTDLYYKSPTQEGNTGLKPERTSEFTLGSHFRTKGLRTHLRLFHRHQRSMIDWIMTPADIENGFTKYHAANFKMDNMGLHANAELLLPELAGKDFIIRSLSANYSYIHQKRHDDVEVYASSYALDYLRHKVVVRMDARLLPRLTAALTWRWQQRMGNYVKYTPETQADGTIAYTASTVSYRPYGLLDLRLAYAAPRFDVYVEGSNLTSHRYYDLGNVRQPGFWLMSGLKVKF